MIYNTLNQMKAKSLDTGKYADGQGLWLVKRSKVAGKWVLRLTVHGKRREMGLGAWPDVTLAEARERAGTARKQLRDGNDPIVERQKATSATQSLTVAKAIAGCFDARKAELKHDGEAGRWMSPLQTHIIPKIGRYSIVDVDQHVLRTILEPIWHDKPEAAAKALNRMNLTLKHAAALGLDVDLQATMKARALLGKQRHQVTHIPSLPYQEAPQFYKWLKTKNGIAVLALRFLILTVARTSEVRLAQFDEIEDGIWILSSDRTKTGRPQRIPLVADAAEIIHLVREQTSGTYLFPSYRGKPLSDAAMSSFMKREDYLARPHGFRATFRTWVEETTDTPFEVKEAALGHQVDSDVVRAYQRSDRLESRRTLLSQWAAFLNGS